MAFYRIALLEVALTVVGILVVASTCHVQVSAIVLSN